jgi:hypothetical protein
VAVLIDQLRVKAGNRAVDDLDGIERQPADGESRPGEGNHGWLVFFGEREAKAGHAQWDGTFIRASEWKLIGLAASATCFLISNRKKPLSCVGRQKKAATNSRSPLDNDLFTVFKRQQSKFQI